MLLRPGISNDHVGSKVQQLRRVGSDTVGIGPAEAQINPQVAFVDPAELCQSVSECRDGGLSCLSSYSPPADSIQTRRIRSGCCARAPSDHTAAPPTSVMKLALPHAVFLQDSGPRHAAQNYQIGAWRYWALERG
jgi:hypothetical protein